MPRLLCVEDNEDTCFLLKTLFGRQDYEVEYAANSQAALVLAKEKSFDLYILDNRCGDGTGVELCRRIREFDPHTPIVFYSAARS